MTGFQSEFSLRRIAVVEDEGIEMRNHRGGSAFQRVSGVFLRPFNVAGDVAAQG